MLGDYLVWGRRIDSQIYPGPLIVLGMVKVTQVVHDSLAPVHPHSPNLHPALLLQMRWEDRKQNRKYTFSDSFLGHVASLGQRNVSGSYWEQCLESFGKGQMQLDDYTAFCPLALLPSSCLDCDSTSVWRYLQPCTKGCPLLAAFSLERRNHTYWSWFSVKFVVKYELNFRAFQVTS